MKKSLILLRKNSFTYNNKKYSIEELSNLCDERNADFFIVILEEELYAKHFFIGKDKVKFVDLIAYKIKSEFPQNGDMLYDYERSSDDVYAIYSMKGGLRLAVLEKYAENLEIKPLQIIVRDIIKEKFKDFLNSNFLIKLEEYYYYISLKKGLFFYCFAERNLDTMVQRVNETNENGILNTDMEIKNISVLQDRFKINNIKIEDYIYEKIYEKQKLHIRKFL